MLIRIASLLCFSVTVAIAATAQTNEPMLISASLPQYPHWLAKLESWAS